MGQTKHGDLSRSVELVNLSIDLQRAFLSGLRTFPGFMAKTDSEQASVLCDMLISTMCDVVALQSKSDSNEALKAFDIIVTAGRSGLVARCKQLKEQYGFRVS